MRIRDDGGPGSAEWTRERLLAISLSPTWGTSIECSELVTWLYAVAGRRARRFGLRGTEAQDVVQDSMTRIARSLGRSARPYAESRNAAAILEHVAAVAVAEAYHSLRMCGYSGAAPNGSTRNVPYPVRISAQSVPCAFEDFADSETSTRRRVDEVAARVSRWVQSNVGVMLTEPALDAMGYVLDRLVCGVGRVTLVTGGHSRLRADPAMKHLGLSPDAAGGFAVWLLGREDEGHHVAAVLDSAMTGSSADLASLERWRRDALRHGFATPTRSSRERLSA